MFRICKPGRAGVLVTAPLLALRTEPAMSRELTLAAYRPVVRLAAQ